MLSCFHYERELVGDRKVDADIRCLRCNVPLLAPNLAVRSEGLCAACAEGKTIQWTS
jgi:hypothetical protein